jgi:hypothetical protein
LADDQVLLLVPSGAEPAARLVRSWVAIALEGIPLIPRLTVAVVVDELVSNACRHGRLPCVLRLCLDITRRYMLVSVDDAAPDDGTEWLSRAGLTLVDGLASDWAVHQRPQGKTVWAEVALGFCPVGLVRPPQPPPDAWAC